MQITPNDFTTIINVVATNASAIIKVNLIDYPNYATVLVPGPFLSN
jgi:hypothetical protein